MLSVSRTSRGECIRCHGLHLALADHMHEFDAAQQDPGAMKILEAEHRPRASFDRPMILHDNVVQVLVLANLDRCFPLCVECPARRGSHVSAR